MGPKTPEVTDFTLTQKTSYFNQLGNRETQAYNYLVQGDVRFEELKKIASDWIPEDPAGVRFRDAVVEALNRLLNDTPDYDTGWFYAEAGDNSYEIGHNIGAVPKRATVYFSEVEEPVAGKDTVWHISCKWNIYQNLLGQLLKYGVYLIHSVDGKSSFILTAADYVRGWGTDGVNGYLRVLLWR